MSSSKQESRKRVIVRGSVAMGSALDSYPLLPIVPFWEHCYNYFCQIVHWN